MVEISVFLLYTVITVICVFVLMVSFSVFLNWLCWTRGNFLASWVAYISVCMSLRCVECRAGTSIFGRFAGVGGGPVRIFCVLGSVLACVCVIEQVGGVAGQYGFSSLFCFDLAGR